eukprot:941419-Pleurochrysis_carterae.AAC.2
MAVGLTVRKEGRMHSGKIAGMFVVDQPHGVGGLRVCAHYVATDSFNQQKGESAPQQTRLRSVTTVSVDA